MTHILQVPTIAWMADVVMPGCALDDAGNVVSATTTIVVGDIEAYRTADGTIVPAPGAAALATNMAGRLLAEVGDVAADWYVARAYPARD